MRPVVWLLGAVVDEWFTARTRWACARHGHRLLCTSDGHLCVRCGRTYPKEATWA